VDKDEYVAIDADAPRNVRGELGAESSVPESALGTERCDRARWPRRTSAVRLIRLMAGRDREDVEGVMHAVGGQGLRRRPVLAFAGRSDKDLHRPGAHRRDGRSAERAGKVSFAARQRHSDDAEQTEQNKRNRRARPQTIAGKTFPLGRFKPPRMRRDLTRLLPPPMWRE